MAIVNVTPDSFSDGGLHADVEAAVVVEVLAHVEAADPEHAAGVDAAQAPQYLLDTGVPGNPWVVSGREPQQKISVSEDLVWKLDDDVVNTAHSPDQLQQSWANAQVREGQDAKGQRYNGDEGARQEIQDLLNRWSGRDDGQRDQGRQRTAGQIKRPH